jgi:hypothetical protein
MDMRIVVQIRRAQDEHSGIAVATVADDRFQKGDLKCLTDVEDAKAPRWVLARIGEPT